MSERAKDMTPGEYQEFVASRIFEPHKPGWEGSFATYVKDELAEVMVEYDHAAPMLLAGDSGVSEPVAEPEAEAMLDELMDMSWFGAAIAEQSGLDIGELSVASLERHTGQNFEHASTLRALQKAVMQNAVSIEIAKGTPDSVNLQVDPIRALKRVTQRLRESLTGGRDGHIEAVVDRKEAIGDYANTIFYIVGARLGWDIEVAVLYNANKLMQRDPWGKGKDGVECTYGKQED